MKARHFAAFAAVSIPLLIVTPVRAQGLCVDNTTCHGHACFSSLNCVNKFVNADCVRGDCIGHCAEACDPPTGSLLTCCACFCGGSVHDLKVQRIGSQLKLTWAGSCSPSDTDFEVYEGFIAGDFSSHKWTTCTTGGAMTHTMTPLPGNTYYLVVPRGPTTEGSYGRRSDLTERPQGVTVCLPLDGAACE